jgi:hypothetical protein
MNTIRVIFTRRRWNPVSWLIRWAVPRSRFALALSSHCIVDAGDKCYEATMLHGVRDVPLPIAMKGQVLIKETRFSVRNRAAAIAFLEAQVCRYKPKLPRWLPKWLRVPLTIILVLINNNYDFKGAFGLALAPDRDWAEADLWYCYELVAAALQAGGRPVFANLTHVGETALMSINP